MSASKRTTNKAPSPRRWSSNHSRGRFFRLICTKSCVFSFDAK
nr:MAG TPA: hypothetical protein [Caudoviricetes sp.]